jgi:hypothetical protein
VLHRPALALAAVALVACGARGPLHHARAAGPGPPPPCATTVDAEVRAIAARIYEQAAAGRAVAAVRRRLGHAPALGAAVVAGDPAATRLALRPLLKNQIRRIVITRGAHVLADEGTTAALGPIRGVVREGAGRPVGRYVAAVASDAATAGIIRAVTGARVAIAPDVRAPLAVAGEAYPAGPLRIGLWPAAPVAGTCGATAQATRAAVVAQVGRRLFAAESNGPATHRVLRHVALDRGFRAAVAARDPAALRAAIIRFFRQRTLHVVRIRATDRRGRLIGDVGGPDVLAPASRTVRDARGRVIGRVTLSIQDDAGYVKLVHRFTGAGVALRTAAGPVPGGVAVAGTPVRYVVRAFPGGALAVRLSVP